MIDDKYDDVDLAATGTILRIDLHGKTRAESEKYILEELASYRIRHDINKLFIITGRGNHILPTGQRGVLFKWLPKWLKSCEFKDDILAVNPDVGCYEVVLKEKKPDVILQGLVQRKILSSLLQPKKLQHLEKKPSKTPQDLYMLGIGCIYRADTEAGIAKGISYLTQAAKQEHVEASEMLGCLYRRGIPGKLRPNHKKGAKFLLKAERLGCKFPELLNELAACYFLGQGVLQNDETAITYMEAASTAGSADAQFNLAIIYLNGTLEGSKTFAVKQDDTKAYHYFKMAAENGYHRAYRKLALMYQKGWGVTKDIKKAFFWYKKGAAAGDLFCIHNVGVGYSGVLGKDIGEPLDPVKGFAYLKRSADLGDSDSEFEVGVCLFLGRGIADNVEQAIEYFKKAKYHGNSKAYYFCGVSAVLKNETKQAIEDLTQGKSAGCERCKKLLVQLEKSRWFEKTPEEQYEFIFDILQDLDGFFDQCSEETLIFAEIILSLTLHYFPDIYQKMRGCLASYFLLHLSTLVLRVGYDKFHSYLLSFHNYVTLININDVILGISEKDIKTIKEQFSLLVLKNLLPSHVGDIKYFSEKIHHYIINYSIAEEYFKQGKTNKAIPYLQKCLSLFSTDEFAYLLVKPSLQKISNQIATEQSLVLEEKAVDKSKVEAQDIEKKTTLAFNSRKHIYQFFPDTAKSLIVTAAVVAGIARLEASIGSESVKAQYNLGVTFLEGGWYSDILEIEQDFTKAYHYLSMAAERGFYPAYRPLAIIYQDGLGVAKDVKKAFAWYKKGAEAGDLFCIHNTGSAYMGALGDIGELLNPVKGFTYLKRSADLGYSDSELAAGKCLFLGMGVADDFEQAIKYFKKALQQGNSEAYYFCGITAVLEYESKLAIDYLTAGQAQEGEHGERCASLLKCLKEKQWFKKTPEEQVDFAFSMLADPNDFFNQYADDTPVFAAMIFDLVLAHFPDVFQEMPGYIAHEFLNQLTMLALKVGYHKYHTFILAFQSYAALIAINEIIVGTSKVDIKKIKEGFKDCVLNNLLPSHAKTIRDFSEKIHDYIKNYSIAEKFFSQGKTDKAIVRLKKSLNLFAENEIAYLLIEPSLEKIKHQITTKKPPALEEKADCQSKSEIQDMEEKKAVLASTWEENEHQFSQGIAESPATAADLHEVASYVKAMMEAESAEAAELQCGLGIMHLANIEFADTFEIKQDQFAKAYHYFSKAARNGCYPAYHQLAMMHQGDLGMAKDTKKAFAWYKKGAAAGDIACIYKVGIGYAGVLGEDIGEPLDLAKAFDYLKRAADLGDSNAALEVGKLFFFGRGIADDFEQAVTYFEKAYAGGNLGSHYYCGVISILKDRLKQAADYFKEGKQNGHEGCQKLLEQLQKTRWLEKTPKQQHDFVVNIARNYDQLLDVNYSIDPIIFSHIFLKIEIDDFLNSYPKMTGHQAINSITDISDLLLKIGYDRNHSMILMLENYTALIAINRYILDGGSVNIKTIKEKFKETVLKNILPSHSETIRDLSQKTHHYIINYSVVEEYFKQGRYDKAILFLEKSLTLFSKVEISYFLIKPSLQQISSKILIEQSFVLEEKVSKESKIETQDIIEEKQTMAESHVCKNVYRFFQAATESPIVTSAVVGGVAAIYAFYKIG